MKLCGFIFLASAGLLLAQPAEGPEGGARTNAVVITPEYISRLVAEARTNNPSLRAADSRVNSASLNAQAVRTWEDPVARAGGMVAREELRASDGDLVYGVEQKLPLFGKPAAARRVALAGLAAETASGVYQVQLLKRDLAKAAYRTGLADEVVLLGR